MTATATKTSSVKKIQFSITTPHTYLADDSDFQSVIREVTEEYIERKQDEALRQDIKKSQKLGDLDALFLSKV
jgi:hypothetical protein